MTKDSERLLSASRGGTAKSRPLGNPLDFIVEDHMREREVCALFDKLVATLPVSKSERRMMLAFLNEQLPQHLADEEIDLFPLMLERCDPEDEIERVIDRLESDHEHAIADASVIAEILAENELDGGALSDLARAQMTDFARHARRHLILENAILLPIARVRLTRDDLETMRSHMIERRDLGRRPEDEAR